MSPVLGAGSPETATMTESPGPAVGVMDDVVTRNVRSVSARVTVTTHRLGGNPPTMRAVTHQRRPPAASEPVCDDPSKSRGDPAGL